VNAARANRGRSDDGVEITRHVAPPYPDNWHAATDVVVDAEAEHLADAL
jgi:hypothetical protein